ncbi:TolA protein [Balamuthia mandrillaris]
MEAVPTAQVLNGTTDVEKLEDLASRTYKDQVVWFLNAFWEEFAKEEAERLWKFKHLCAELDLAKKDQGCALDELQAHRFLEKLQETMTVQQMRDKLRSTGAIGAKVRLVPLIHLLIFRFDVDWHFLVNAPQGSKEEIEKAQRMFDQVQAAFREAEARADEAAAALKEAKAREADAKAREEELRVAKAELEAALKELQAQEEAYNNKTAELKRASEEGGLVSRNKAKNELAQHLGEDPLPLRRAKITQEAAVKKADRAAQVAAEARAQAEEATRQSEKAKAAAEEAVEEARRKLEEAEAYLEKAKNSLPKGAVWWLERELHEARAYLPVSKGGYKKDK